MLSPVSIAFVARGIRIGGAPAIEHFDALDLSAEDANRGLDGWMLSNLRLQRLLAGGAERLLPLDQARRRARGARVAIVEDNPSRGAPKLGQLALEGGLSRSGDRRSMKPGVARKGEDHFARTQRDQPAIGERCAQARGALPNRLRRPVPAFGRGQPRLVFAWLGGGR